MPKKPEFAIINSFDKFDQFIFVLNYIRYIPKLVYSFVFNRKKYKSDLEKFKRFNEFKHNIYGHMSLNCSLLRGLKKLKIPFSFNKVTKHTKYLILLWVDRKEMQKVQKIKQKYPDIKIVTAPTACKSDGGLLHEFTELDYIDYNLVASDCVKKSLETDTDEKFKNKIQVWPSGVDVKPLVRDKKIHNAVLCYYKLLPENKNITQYLENNGIKTYVLEYGKYILDEYNDVLSRVDFVIFIQNVTETQGLAMAEAWAKNRPTIIKYNEGGFGANSCPYLTKETGLFYKSEKDLFSVIDSYVDNPSKFLEQFNPYQVVKNEFSDEASVLKLIKILKS